MKERLLKLAAVGFLVLASVYAVFLVYGATLVGLKIIPWFNLESGLVAMYFATMATLSAHQTEKLGREISGLSGSRT
jgi:hypothetical protein